MWEDDDRPYIEIDAPGMTEKDIDVWVHAGDLIIRGERRSERQDKGYDTRSYGKFEQRISLPTPSRPKMSMPSGPTGSCHWLSPGAKRPSVVGSPSRVSKLCGGWSAPITK